MSRPIPHIALRKRRGKWRWVVIDPPGGRVRMMTWVAASRVATAKGDVRAAHESMSKDFIGWTLQGALSNGA